MAFDTGMIDQSARTHAQLIACAKRGQWAHVMTIGGFKSEASAREAYKHLSITIRPRGAKPVAVLPAPQEEEVFSNHVGAYVKPAPRSWCLSIRSRIAAIGLTLGDVSLSMGHGKSYLPNRLMATGHCCQEARDQIEAHLARLEAQFAQTEATDEMERFTADMAVLNSIHNNRSRQLHTVAALCGVTLQCLQGSDRTKTVTMKRFRAYYMLHLLDYSYPHIGKLLNRDHTTILHGARTYAATLAASQIEAAA